MDKLFDIEIKISELAVRERPPHFGATGGDTCTDRCDNATLKAAGCP